MELRTNARVPNDLPEDAGLLTGFAETLSSEVCQNYNRGNRCSACNLQHICLRCNQHGHPVSDCDRGVLRVSSGNAGTSAFHSHTVNLKTETSQEYDFRHVSSLVNPPHHSAQAAIKANHSRRQQNSLWSSRKGHRWYEYWHIEWETERYRKYREKCREGSKNIWPDDVEEAFQMAIRRYQNPGRKKLMLNNGKQAGGNEYISDFIMNVTGQFRCRKQVSSHLQVERSLLRENKAWSSLVAGIKTEESKKKAHGSAAPEETAAADEKLEYDDASIYRASEAPYPLFPNHASSSIEMLASEHCQGPTLCRVSEFAMTLKDKVEDKRGIKAVRHVYTSIQSETPSAPKALVHVNNWREMHPALAAYHDRGPIDCPIFLFDAHLSLMEECYPSELEITFCMDFGQGAHFTEWRSCPRFYEQNGCPADLAESSDVLYSAPLEGTDNCRVGQVPFRSKWWAQVFTDMIQQKMITERKGDPELVREEEERASQYVQGLSVMQEIWATPRASNRGPQRMAILLWSFSTARRGEAATTSWRNLVPPLSAYDIQSPHPPAENPPMTLDTALQVASPYFAHGDSQHGIFSECPAGDMLTAPLCEDSSSSTTPTPQSRSFPSSTLDSAHPSYPGQGSPLQSQDPAYPALGIFDSQDSGYTLYEHHEVSEKSQGSYESHESAGCSQESYGSQDIIHHSQDSLYQPDALNELFEYPYHIVEAPITGSASQDFTGGQIHLSYAEPEDSQSPYEGPLIAPQAHMVPQHQLIQHPEHFDQHDYLEQNPDDLSCGHDELDEQTQAQALPQTDELNELAIDYSAWEETLRTNPDLEHHLSINVGEEVE